MILTRSFTSLFFLLLVTFFSSSSNSQVHIPYLQEEGNAVKLVVEDKPFLMLAGELGNSSASDLNYMRQYWQKLKAMNLNTVLTPVYWELIEPEEGKFDFTLVDSLIVEARNHDLKLVFLWFATWKNSVSCYAPLWVKTNPDHFPLSKTLEGESLQILSVFSEENRNADAKAFAELMKHIKNIDEKENTVIMIQVENEIGMIPQSRDFSKEANVEFLKPVPQELIDYLIKNDKNLIPEFRRVWLENGSKKSGTWVELFGEGLHTNEIFMAWHFAKYVEYVTQKGKEIYPLPMYVNAALIRPGYSPGQYPSAGPLPHLIDIWRAAAPSIDFLSPDIYFSNFEHWCRLYNRSGNPLFIPEAALNETAPVNAFYSFGEHDAIGFSPFSIENLDTTNSKLPEAYKILDQLSPVILSNYGKKRMRGILVDESEQTKTVNIGNYTFTVSHDYTLSWVPREKSPWERMGGMIIQAAPDEFYIAGSGIVVTFGYLATEKKSVGIGWAEEGEFVNGEWKPGRRLNGDQTHQGRHVTIPNKQVGIQKVKLYLYE